VRETADGERRRVFTRHSGGSHLEDATLWALVARVGRWLEVLECGRPPRDAAPSLGWSTPSEELRLRVQVSWSMFRRSHRIRRRLHTACPPAAVPLRLDSRAVRTLAMWGDGEAWRKLGGHWLGEVEGSSWGDDWPESESDALSVACSDAAGWTMPPGGPNRNPCRRTDRHQRRMDLRHCFPPRPSSSGRGPVSPKVKLPTPLCLRGSARCAAGHMS